MDMNRQNGFTIIELMIAVMLVALLLTLGVPSFTNTIEQNRLATEINSLISTLQYARSESVKTGKRITVCRSDDGVDCGATGYEDGWIVFEDDVSPDGDLDAGERLLKVHQALDANYTLRGSNNISSFISYLPTGGTVNANQDRFVLCKNNTLSKARALFVITSGRSRVAKDNNHDKIPEDDAGNNITTCTPA